jgi:hypothetical protein
MSNVLSILALCVSVVSAFYTGWIVRIERNRDRVARRPPLSATYEDYGGGHPYLLIINNGSEDIADLRVEFQKPLIGYVPAITSLSGENGEDGPQVDLGGLAAGAEKRLRIHRDNPKDQYGPATLYAHCKAANGDKWRDVIVVDIPQDITP